MSKLNLFSEEDFNVFEIEGLDPRMDALKRLIRPKFEMIGEQVAPYLTLLLQEPIYVHIAKHARRTVHPPDETWLAWSTNKRGYKAHPHFQVGLRQSHLFIWFSLIYECDKKGAFARHLKNRLNDVWREIPESYFISQDHTQPEAVQKKEMGTSDMVHLLDRLEKVKRAEFLCGVLIPQHTVVQLTTETVMQRIEETFKVVYPLYRLCY